MERDTDSLLEKRTTDTISVWDGHKNDSLGRKVVSLSIHIDSTYLSSFLFSLPPSQQRLFDLNRLLNNLLPAAENNYTRDQYAVHRVRLDPVIVIVHLSPFPVRV